MVQHQWNARRIAAKAIVANCVKCVERLDNEANHGGFTAQSIASFEDEATADAATLAAFPIANVDDQALIAHIFQARRQMTTARRRVGQARSDLEAGKPNIAQVFAEPKKRLEEILTAIEADNRTLRKGHRLTN